LGLRLSRPFQENFAACAARILDVVQRESPAN
jgi:hypothetical protein